MASCYNHPDYETGITCTQCDRAMCPTCMVFAAVGQICRDCARGRRPINYQVSLRTLCVAAPLATIASMMICAIALLVIAPLPFFVLYLLLTAAYFVAGVLTSLLDRLTRAKRGRMFQIAIGTSLAVGALPVLCAAALLFSMLDVALLTVFASTLVFSMMLRLQ